jgi:hypothetical protein
MIERRATDEGHKYKQEQQAREREREKEAKSEGKAPMRRHSEQRKSDGRRCGWEF